MSSREIADRLERIDHALGNFGDALVDLKRQQKELSDRIAFVMPTDGDVSREVDEFVRKALAA